MSYLRWGPAHNMAVCPFGDGSVASTTASGLFYRPISREGLPRKKGLNYISEMPHGMTYFWEQGSIPLGSCLHSQGGTAEAQTPTPTQWAPGWLSRLSV